MVSNDAEKPAREVEHRGPLWTHPYFVYILLTVFLFGVLLFVSWLALENGWIPNQH